MLALGLAGCGDGSSNARERAIEQSKEAFETAVRQGVDIARTPCIYYPNAPDGINTWFAIVVFPDDDSPRAAAVAAGRPGAKTLGYVALNESGEVIEVRGIPDDGEARRQSNPTRRAGRKFTPPKHGVVGTIALAEPARERLPALPRESEYAFTTLRGTHYTPSARSPHWNRVRCRHPDAALARERVREAFRQGVPISA
ncbi:MAG: hypothetical protein ACRDLU_00880 [Gaiellaceae bacterium]